MPKFIQDNKILVAVVLGVVLVILVRNTGSTPSQANTPQQAEQIAQQVTDRAVTEIAGQVEQALAPTPTQEPPRNAAAELANWNLDVVDAPKGKLCGGDNSLSFGDVLEVPGRPNYYLWVNYEQGFGGGGVDGEGCGYTVLYIPPGSPITSPNIDPMACLKVYQVQHPAITFTFRSGFSMDVVVHQPSLIIPNGFFDQESGVYCVNGSYYDPKAKG